VKQLAHDPFPASGLVTVTLRVPVVALEASVTFAVSEVAETNVVEFTVIPVPEKAAVAPLTNPVPVIVIDWLEAPWPRELGLVEDTVGPALTVKHPVHEPDCVSGFVTVTFREPVVAFEVSVTFAVSEVAETNVVEFTVIPVPEKDAVAPDTKFVPVIVMFWPDALWPRELGLVDETVGAGSTVTVELFGLSVPDQTPCIGVTEYFHDPAGTLFSVQLRPTIVPEHADPIDCRTLVDAS
jgi:hypothetical protein